MESDSAPWVRDPSEGFSPAQRYDHNQSRRRWWRAVIIVTAWLIALAILALATANPVTVNRLQVLEAEDVLTVTVDDWLDGRFRVEKSWKGRLKKEQIQLRDLPAEPQPAGTRLLIPITRDNDRLIVAPSHLPNRRPLIYPANAEAERQLQSLLTNGKLP